MRWWNFQMLLVNALHFSNQMCYSACGVDVMFSQHECGCPRLTLSILCKCFYLVSLKYNQMIWHFEIRVIRTWIHPHFTITNLSLESQSKSIFNLPVVTSKTIIESRELASRWQHSISLQWYINANCFLHKNVPYHSFFTGFVLMSAKVVACLFSVITKHVNSRSISKLKVVK